MIIHNQKNRLFWRPFISTAQPPEAAEPLILQTMHSLSPPPNSCLAVALA
jgi:hypothetical protein